jgi:SAM-dependent methyltransferase
MTTDPSPDYIVQLGLGFTAAKTLLSGVETGVFTELARSGPLDVKSLCTRLSLNPRAAQDFFDTLVALGFLERDGGLYANTDQAAFFLDRAKPSYIGDGLEMVNSRLYGFWGNLTDALRTGKSQNEDSADMYAGIYADPDRLRLFQRAMSQMSRPSMQALASAFPWEDRASVVDIGCGDGALLGHLLDRHPHLDAVGFDLPASKATFAEPRAAFVPGDYTAGPLPTAEVLVMGHVLHDLDAAGKRALLAKAYEALPEGGALVVFEPFLDDDRRANLPGLLLSLNVLIETPAGEVCTVSECVLLLREAGFSEVGAAPLAGPESMVMGFR